MRTLGLGAWLALATLSALGTEFYCLPEGYKVKPDGTLVEFGGKPPGKLAESNLVFSKAKGSLTLAGARNETVGFQVVVQGEAKDVTVSLDGLKGPGEIAAARVEVSLIGFVQVGDKSETAGYFPDVCVPLARLGGKFDVPYALKGLAKPPDQKVGLVWVEIAIPADAKPGRYDGALKLAGGSAAEFKVELTVWDFAMPAAPSIVYDVNAYGSPVDTLGADQANPYQPTPKEVIENEHKFYRLFNRHRQFLNIMPYHSQRGTPRYAPMLKGDGKETVCDWKYWDERFGGVLSGEIFEDRQPVPHFYLPFNLHWPYGYSHDASLKDQRIDFKKNPTDYRKSLVPAWEETFKAVAKQCVEHFAEKGWKQTCFQVYLNHSAGKGKEHSYSAWRLDEPYDKYGFAVLQWYAKLTNEFMRDNDKGVQFGYRLDIGHWNCRDPKMQCYKPKQWEPDHGEEMLEPFVDLWYIGSVHSYGNRQRIPQLLAKGPHKQAFIYGGGELISGGAPRHRALMWSQFALGERGYCAWKIGAAPPAGDAAHGGGDSICYTGKDLGLDEPLASLRMKSWRRSSYDAEYLKLAKAKDAAKTQALLEEMCPFKANPASKYAVVESPVPNNNPEDWDLARLELAGTILSKDLLKGAKRSGPIEGAPTNSVDQITGY